MPDVDALLEGIRAQRRAAVSQAITLVESSKREHRSAARELLTALAEDDASGVRSPAVRVGVSGVPGVGKSTFIESLGTRLTAQGHRVGVLAVDPSSIRTGGSVLGDKTRMAQAVGEPERLHPALAGRRHPRRRRPRHGAGDGGARGGGVRRGAGRDRRRRPVRGDRGRDGRHVPVPDPGPHRRPAAGDQEGHPRDRRRDRGQQGRRRPARTRPGPPRGSWPARCGWCTARGSGRRRW